MHDTNSNQIVTSKITNAEFDKFVRSENTNHFIICSCIFLPQKCSSLCKYCKYRKYWIPLAIHTTEHHVNISKQKISGES